jgi:sugar O-acyltransferase (sialic acid O-acetyltransferase NeuD family)
MAKDIVVLGAAATSHSIMDALESVNQLQPAWNILGFVDDNPALHGTEVYGYGVLGGSELVLKPEFRYASVVIGVANEGQLLIRKKISERLGLPPERYPVIVHPSASVSPKARLGPGCVVLFGTRCSGGAKLGSHVVVLEGSCIGHDCEISSFATVCCHATVGAYVRMGEGAFISTGAHLRVGISVGAESKVGMGSVALRNVPAGKTVFGNPAAVLDLGAPAVRQGKKGF